MHYIGWAVFGLVAGAIARFLHPGRDPMNWIWTMLLGIGGAFLGGYVVESIMGPGSNEGIMSWVAAVGGAIVLLVVYHLLTAKSAAAPIAGPATSDDYKKAVFNDLSSGPNG